LLEIIWEFYYDKCQRITYSKYHSETNEHNRNSNMGRIYQYSNKEGQIGLNYNKLREVIKISWVDKIFSLVDLTLVKIAS
jgi:hypothetical protein